MTQQEQPRAWLLCSLEHPPEDPTPDEWEQWCSQRVLQPATPTPEHPGPRAWVHRASAYLEHGDTLVYLNGVVAAVLTNRQLLDQAFCRPLQPTHPSTAPQAGPNIDQWYHTTDPDAPFARATGLHLAPDGTPVPHVTNYQYAGCAQPHHIIPTDSPAVAPNITVTPFERTQMPPQYGWCPSCDQMGLFTMHDLQDY